MLSFHLQVRKYGGWKLLLHSNFDVKELPFYNFYLEILHAFTNIFDISENRQVIWNNKFIKIGGQHIFWENWYNAGIVCLKDLFSDNGNFKSQAELISKFGVQCDLLTYLGFKRAVMGALKYFESGTAELKNITKEDIEKTVFITKIGGRIDISKANTSMIRAKASCTGNAGGPR